MSESVRELCGIAGALQIPFSDESAPMTGYITANGLRMHYLDWGHSDKPNLLFLHGASLTAHTWDLVCLSLRSDYHCIALDQRGHGLTNGVHEFGLEQPREDIRAAVASLGLKRFALVGMSLGGNNAIAYAGDQPEELAAVVFIDVCPSVLPDGYQDALDFEAKVEGRESLDAAVAAAVEHNPRGTPDYKRYTLGYSLTPDIEGRWQFRYHRTGVPQHTSEDMALYMARRREKLWELVPKIHYPSLIVHGTESRAQNRDNLWHFDKMLPNGRLVEISGAGHDVQEDQPARLVQILREFFRDIHYGQ